MADLLTGAVLLSVLAYATNRRNMRRARHIFDLPDDVDGGQ